MGFKHEENLQIVLAEYMKYQYKDIIFRSDFAAGIKMTMGQAVRHKRMQAGRSYPDFFVAFPSRNYHGLFLELKQKNASVLPYRQNGKLSSNAHIQGQALVLARLNALGYYARFAVGIDQAQAILDWYIGRKKEIAEPMLLEDTGLDKVWRMIQQNQDEDDDLPF